MIEDYRNENRVQIKENFDIWSMNVLNEDYGDVWNQFLQKSFVSMDIRIKYVDNDYTLLNNIDEIRSYLNDEKSRQPLFINNFVNKMKKGDIFIAHKGNVILSAIGIVTGDYNYNPEGTFKHTRSVNWFYIADDLRIADKFAFKPSGIVDLGVYHYFVNELLCKIAASNEKVKKNLLDFIFNSFYNNFYSKKQGQDHFNEYDVERKYINEKWNLISQADYKTSVSIIWEDIFRRDVGVIRVGARNLRKQIQGQSKRTEDNVLSDEDMDQMALKLYDVVNEVVGTSDEDYQKRILKEYSKSKLSYGLKSGRVTPILYYLDNSFYPINNKTIRTMHLISLILGEDITLSDELKDYIDNNKFYKEFLIKLNNVYPFDKFDIADVRIFDELCHWMNSIENYAHTTSKIQPNIFPLEILGDLSSNNHIIDDEKSFVSNEKRNIIYFGAPGTGKSYNLNQDKDILLKDYPENYERVTFHPDYSYANFVGTYKPVPENKSITYKYVPGPFMRVLKNAIENPNEPYLLIIEEINRANVAAVFGDVFQLLDRNSENESEYDIETSQDMRRYINEDKIKLPSNLFIWATMNSADQGVFPMDTAFKRRWDFKYFSINSGEDLIKNTKTTINGIEINWNTLRKEINHELLSYKINEDKLMGPFFAFNEFMNEKIDEEIFKDIFKNKIIMYLFEDAARSRRNELFLGVGKTNVTYSQICESFDEKGIEIFTESIKNKFITEDDD